MTRVILSLRRVPAPPGAVVVVDHLHLCFWRDGRAHFRTVGTRPPILRFRIITALLLANGRRLSHRDLQEICYSDREDGGPLAAHDTIRRTISLCRAGLAGLGFAVAARGNLGYLLKPLSELARAA